MMLWNHDQTNQGESCWPRIHPRGFPTRKRPKKYKESMNGADHEINILQNSADLWRQDAGRRVLVCVVTVFLVGRTLCVHQYVLMTLFYPVKTGSQTSRPTSVVSACVNGVDKAEHCWGTPSKFITPTTVYVPVECSLFTQQDRRVSVQSTN